MRSLRKPNGAGFKPPDRCVFWKTGACGHGSDYRLFKVTAYPKGFLERAEYVDALMCLVHRREVEAAYEQTNTFCIEWELHQKRAPTMKIHSGIDIDGGKRFILKCTECGFLSPEGSISQHSYLCSYRSLL